MESCQLERSQSQLIPFIDSMKSETTETFFYVKTPITQSQAMFALISGLLLEERRSVNNSVTEG